MRCTHRSLLVLALLLPSMGAGCCTIYLGDSLDGARFGNVELARDRDQGELDILTTAKYGKGRKAERWMFKDGQMEAFRYKGPMNRDAILKAARKANVDELADALYDLDSSGGADLEKVETLWERDVRGVSIYIFFRRKELVGLLQQYKAGGRRLPELDTLTLADPNFRDLEVRRNFNELPEGVEVYFFPKKLPVTAWGTTKNVIKYFIFPIAIALDIATFPIQVIFLGASGDD